MKLLFCGDIVGKSGRKVVSDCLPVLRRKLALDCVIVNGENAAHGFGITPKIYQELRSFGADAVTLGNHSFDKKDIFDVLSTDEPLIRPLNYPENTLGRGFYILTLKNGFRLAVVQLLGRALMRTLDDPFKTIAAWMKLYQKGRDYDGLFVDMHAETTAEKRAMGAFLNGKALLVAGTHTHIPTADACLLSKATGYISDVGMCGDYYSVIGMTEESALRRFIPEEGQRTYLQPASGAGTFCGVVIEFEPAEGGCRKIFPVRWGAHLENTIEL